ncbi:MAG: DUF92 domain-containing protein [Chthonomonadales bacterium]
MTNVPTTQLAGAAALAGAVALASWALRMLNFSGALAAFAVGFFIFAAGSVPFAVPLLLFFLSSSALSRVGTKRKSLAAMRQEKGSSRDAWQVLANGAVPTLFAIAYHTSHHDRMTVLLYLSTLAAANADTWATEIGGLWRGRPRLVTTLRHVEPGTSGGVTLLGLAASLVGAGAIAGTAWLVWPLLPPELRWWRIDAPELITVAWSGFLGAYADSVLGASVQARYRCSVCQMATERRIHCDAPCDLSGGSVWVNNDVVNLWSVTLAAGFAWILLRYFAYPI